MQGYESLISVMVFFSVVGFGGWLAGILWRKFHPFPPGIKHIPIKEITPQGCMGEDGRFIPWNDIQSVIKESQSFPNYSASGSFSIVGHFKTVYRITAAHIPSDTHYELSHSAKSAFTSEVDPLIQVREKFNAQALLLLEKAKLFPRIQFSSWGYWGKEKKSIERECGFLKNWPEITAKRMRNAGGNAKFYYLGLVFFVLMLILGSLLWFKW
jgi:hypothetical protein